MFIDPVNIYFTIPATDPLGKNTVIGKIRFLSDHVELSWRMQGSVFDPQLVKDIPEIHMGKMTLMVDKKSKSEAKKLSQLIDFKRSEFILDAHEQRLKAIREED